MNITRNIIKLPSEERLSQALELYQPALREASYYGIAQAIVDDIEYKTQDMSYKELAISFKFLLRKYLTRIVNITVVDIDYLESIANNLFKISHLSQQPTNTKTSKCFLSFIGFGDFISHETLDNINKNFEVFSKGYTAGKWYCEDVIGGDKLQGVANGG